MKKTILIAGLFLLPFARGEETPVFRQAEPVWPEGKASEMNLLVAFACDFDRAATDTPPLLRVTGSAVYRISLNGQHIGYGPARAATGFFRVDEWPLAKALQSGLNSLLIECASYNVNNFYIPDQPAFLQAEVVAGGHVLAATAPTGDFRAALLPRIQKTARYSFQRAFSEAYTLAAPDAGPWPMRPDFAAPLKLEARPVQPLLPRRAPYPAFMVHDGFKALSAAPVELKPSQPVKEPRFLNASPRFKTFPRAELDINGWQLLHQLSTGARTAAPSPLANGHYALAANHSIVFDGGFNDTGFLGLTVTAEKPVRLALSFDEILRDDGRVDARRLECVNLVIWDIAAAGTYRLETFEPYTARYIQVAALDGPAEISAPTVRGYKNPNAFRLSLQTDDPALNAIFAAACETFAQNAVDVFTDCPSRERAGWLCDSFFIGRANALLCGDTTLERLFLENYALAKSFPHLPEGMVAMCYPADHTDGTFIPNWAMWLILETDDYLARSGDRATVDALRPRLDGIVNFLWKFRNADGLLEKLPSWVFIEWSRANKYVQDVNYPSNMAWAEVLDAMDRLYSRPDLAAEAARVRATVRAQSWDGQWFRDHATRETDGRLTVQNDRSETCQYYAFFFNTATPATHPELWRRLLTDFGPQHKKARPFPDIHASNAFIGNYLRLELLARAKLTEQLRDEVKGYFSHMAERTGTLWEHDASSASCCHGFASYAAVFILRDILGKSTSQPSAN